MHINYNCINTSPPPGAFGGSMCMCQKCCAKRKEEADKVAARDFIEAVGENP